MREAVIAWYKEDLRWLRRLPPLGFQPIVYSKGGQSVRDLRYPVYPLPNVGREAHTYLTHIVTRWDRLADQTLFSQGKYEGQASQMLNFLAGLDEGVPYMEFGMFTLRIGSTEEEANGVPMRAAWRTFFEAEIPEERWECQACAFFLVSKARIRQHPLAAYERVLRWLVETSTGNQDERFGAPGGLAMERLWHQIFGKSWN